MWLTWLVVLGLIFLACWVFAARERQARAIGSKTVLYNCPKTLSHKAYHWFLAVTFLTAAIAGLIAGLMHHRMQGSQAITTGVAVAAGAVFLLTWMVYNLLHFLNAAWDQANQPMPSMQQIAAGLRQELGREPTLEEVMIIRHEIEKQKVVGWATLIGSYVALHHWADVSKGRNL